jgi:hypothetical protein
VSRIGSSSHEADSDGAQYPGHVSHLQQDVETSGCHRQRLGTVADESGGDSANGREEVGNVDANGTAKLERRCR